MSKIISQQEFYGGKSTDDAIGPKASFGYSQSLDFRTNPSKLTVLPGASKISGNVAEDLILNIAQVPNGDRYAYGNTGFIYKIDTNNVFTYLQKLDNGTDGELYRQDTDALYFATSNTIKRYYPLSSTAGVSPSFDMTLAQSRSADTNAYRTGGAASYTVGSTITESSNNQCSFLPDIEPFYSIKVNILSKGTGDWTLTLHDGLNTKLAEVTKLNASIASGLTEFVFTSPVRALVKPNARTYHFHLTSTAAGTVACGTANDLNTADFELWAYRMVQPNNGLHPMITFQQFICIGNERYLSVWEPLSDSNPPNTEYQRHRLTFPPGFEVCGLTPTDEFLVIACEKRSTDASRDFQEGKLFIWDGTATTYNYVIDVDGGSPEGIYTKDNFPYFIVDGDLCAWPGGKNIIKIKKIADTTGSKVNPNTLTTRNNLLLMGFPSTTSDQTVEHGVYSFGTVDKNYPASFGYDYLLSSQTKLKTDTNDLAIGCVRNFGDDLYMSWQEDGKFGLDVVNSGSAPAPTAKYRARRFDAGAIYKTKLALKLGITAETLAEGVAVTPVYGVDNGAEVSLPVLESAAFKSWDIKDGDKRFRDIIYGFDLTNTESTTSFASILSVALEWDALLKEKDL